MEALPRVGVLVERGAVEVREAVRVDRKVRGHPVEDHAQPGPVAAVDEAGEPGGLAVAARRREQPDRLVPPGRVERMLVDRHQLQVREAHVDGVGHQRVGELVVGEPAIALAAPPRSQVDLVDRHRLAPRLVSAPRRHPGLVGPREVRRAADDRRGRRPQLGAEADRVGLERQQLAAGADDFVLVDRAFAQRRDEDLPDAGADALAHHVATAIPAVEVADDGDASRVRRPDGEVHARDALVLDRVRAEPVVEPDVRAFADEPVVERPQHRAVRVDVVDGPRPVAVRGAQSVRGAPRHRAFEEARGVKARERREQVAGGRHRVDGVGAGNERAHHQRAVRLVQTQHREGIAVAALDDRFDRASGQGARHGLSVPSGGGERGEGVGRSSQCPPGSMPQMLRA